MERLSPLSYAFLAAEDVDPTSCLVIGSLAVLDGPAPHVDESLRSSPHACRRSRATSSGSCPAASGCGLRRGRTFPTSISDGTSPCDRSRPRAAGRR